jgi:uncharacterized protein YndB with AHSA1/START domain
MSRNFTVSTQINKPVAEVYKAAVSSEEMCNYFTDKCSSDYVEGETVIYWWENYGDHPVYVKTVKENELIVFTLNSQEWQKTNEVPDYEATVTMKFEALDESSTMFSISEDGWQEDAESIRGSYDNCGGWQHMIMCMKAYLEYGINLRT